MNFVDVLCICQEVPSVLNGTSQESHGRLLPSGDKEPLPRPAVDPPKPCMDSRRISTSELHSAFLDLESGERPSAPIVSKCNVHRPKRKGLFVAHIAVDESCGITQVGTIQWQPLAPVFRAYLSTVQNAAAAKA